MTDPAATGSRQAVLRAARRAFALQPYAQVTLRGIAAEAEVSASLIVKLFGSKEELFAQTADFSADLDELLDAPLNRLGRHMVLTLVRVRRERRTDPLLRVVFSLGMADERTVIRDRFRAQATRRLAGRLPGADAELRAELVLGQLLGLGATLSIHRDGGAGEQADPERLADLCAPGMQRLIDGP
ncbi:TetR/AcrR family transcriptional regulator [Kitasatospora sp. DSM 101779]|uniref:TetR/AcrR family transcriptional regulator n=1 Tax=Kitasatospora sp. DSM 101779 TaxID=2853165 RepID=UPI0021DA2F41|nr:TetR/AcrR family transcriptional regulator [Kitasatospora sp. DSM 101779]MCU7820682.1 TetR family transcriptional regulator [Kitasatospora sp. DSM 101779]